MYIMLTFKEKSLRLVFTFKIRPSDHFALPSKTFHLLPNLNFKKSHIFQIRVQSSRLVCFRYGTCILSDVTQVCLTCQVMPSPKFPWCRMGVALTMVGAVSGARSSLGVCWFILKMLVLAEFLLSPSSYTANMRNL